MARGTDMGGDGGGGHAAGRAGQRRGLQGALALGFFQGFVDQAHGAGADGVWDCGKREGPGQSVSRLRSRMARRTSHQLTSSDSRMKAARMALSQRLFTTRGTPWL